MSHHQGAKQSSCFVPLCPPIAPVHNKQQKGDSIMWLPPYFGDYEKFVQQLLQNPFLGSGGHHLGRHAGPQPDPWRTAGPVPDPWRTAWPPDPVPWATAYLLTLVSTKEAATQMTNKEAAQQIEATADAGIALFLDEYCGTPVPGHHWPYPGPGPWVWEIASQVTLVANTLEQGNLRGALLHLAGQVLDKAFSASSERNAGAQR